VTGASLALELPPPLETPLLTSGSIWVKAEQRQRTGSVKYRMVYAKLRKALQDGAIPSRTRLIEVTSGSTGVALAYAGKTLGLRVELHAYSSMDPDKRTRITEYGADLVVHPATTPVGDLLDLVRARLREGGYWHLGQFERDSTIGAYEELGRELVGQLHDRNARPEFFFCPVGTGGLIQGLGSLLRRTFPTLRIVAVEPAPGEAIEGTRNTELCRLQNDPYDVQFPDEVLRVQRSRKKWSLGDVILGESGSAAYELASRRQRSAVIVAPD
jgi:cysteine synthase A